MYIWQCIEKRITSLENTVLCYVFITLINIFFKLSESPTCANTNCQGNFWSCFRIEKEGCRSQNGCSSGSWWRRGHKGRYLWNATSSSIAMFGKNYGKHFNMIIQYIFALNLGYRHQNLRVKQTFSFWWNQTSDELEYLL